MYKCNNCGCLFEEPCVVRTTYENYYGVGGLFPNHHYLSYECCPNCRDEDFEEVEDEDGC